MSLKKSSRIMAVAVAALAPSVLGCAGARTTIEAPTAKYPVSMSRGVRDAEGSLVPADRRKIVGHFKEKRKAWAMLYSYLSLTPSKDLSDAINAEVAKVNGDAVVNLSVASATCGMNFAAILDILPIWPGCSNVEITGDIIQVLPASAPPAAEPTPAAPTPAAGAPQPPAQAPMTANSNANQGSAQ